MQCCNCGKTKAKYKCEECGEYWCEECADVYDFHCDCYQVKNIKPIKQRKNN